MKKTGIWALISGGALLIWSAVRIIWTIYGVMQEQPQADSIAIIGGADGSDRKSVV